MCPKLRSDFRRDFRRSLLMDRVVFESVRKVFRHRPALFNWLGKERGGETIALKDVSFSAARAEVLALLGPNGSGKTTALKLISTMLLPDAGSVRVGGFDARRDAGEVRRQVGIAVATERSFFPRLSARENLEFFAALDEVSRSRASAKDQRSSPRYRPRRASRHAGHEVLQRHVSAAGHRARPGQAPQRALARRTDAQPRRRHHRPLLGHDPRLGAARDHAFCSPPTTSRKRLPSPIACSCCIAEKCSPIAPWATAKALRHCALFTSA